MTKMILLTWIIQCAWLLIQDPSIFLFTFGSILTNADATWRLHA